MNHREDWMRRAIALAVDNVREGRGGPFGAIIVKDNRALATGVNLVTENNDPTAHAEIVAIRAACRALGKFRLNGCEIYTNCEPCPMCLGAIYWARLASYYYASRRVDAARAGFDDAFIYDEIPLPPERRSIPGYALLSEESHAPFTEWLGSPHKAAY